MTWLPFILYPGVHSVLVALLAEKADIQYDSEATDPEQLVNEIRNLGFGANLLSDGEGYQQGKLELTVRLSCRGDIIITCTQVSSTTCILDSGIGRNNSGHTLCWIGHTHLFVCLTCVYTLIDKAAACSYVD